MGSKKPCPGCGQVDTDRKSTEVCWACRLKLEGYERLKNTVEALEAGEEGMVTVRYGEAWHWNEYLSYDRFRGRSHLDNSERQAVTKAFHALAEAASIRIVRHYTVTAEFDLMGNPDSGQVKALMKREVAEAFVRLHEEVKKSLKAAYDAGKEDGHNLLMRLANGDLAPNEHLDKYGR